MQIKSVLVANRGEIAVRIIRALRELKIKSIAVYSDADAQGMARQMADEAWRLPGNTSAETYLNVPALLEAIKATKADAVHPGYGFLSENAHFAGEVAKAGAKFIGPSVKAMDLLGNKIAARRLMEASAVPMVPGVKEAIRDPGHLLEIAKKIGYPMILKAASGGGGRGMRVVRADSELASALESCTREAKEYFGDPDVFCERYLENPRHIEIQILFDEHGNGVHLFERDCSVQRRHQKLIEEAPSAYLNPAQRQRLGDIAVKAGQVAGYQGAGTVEFICESPERAYFMEVNTRIQVEHTVSEVITGVDLIKEQIRVAMGERLAFSQKDLAIHGWAFEARINAEDPRHNFAPCPGRVEHLQWPQGPGVRIDSHLYPGYEIPQFYDSMVAKLICHGATRDEARDRLRRALSELRIEGIKTTARFHEIVLDYPEFVAGDFTTRFLEEHGPAIQKALQENSNDDLLTLASALLAQTAAAPPQTTAAKEYGMSAWQRIARQEGLRR